MIDRNHDAKDAVHYGAWAGHVTGQNFFVQGNTLASEAVVKRWPTPREPVPGVAAAARHHDRRADALAQRYAQAGNPDEAVAALTEAVRRQPYLKKQAAEDPLFEELRNGADFRELVG